MLFIRNSFQILNAGNILIQKKDPKTCTLYKSIKISPHLYSNLASCSLKSKIQKKTLALAGADITVLSLSNW